jgi:hypothetical protein
VIGTLICGALLGLALLTPASNEIFYILSRPSEAGLFSLVLALLPVLAVGTVAGLTATVQNYRRPAEARRTPRGLYPFLLVLAGLVAGAILLAYAHKYAMPMELALKYWLHCQRNTRRFHARKEIRLRPANLLPSAWKIQIRSSHL